MENSTAIHRWNLYMAAFKEADGTRRASLLEGSVSEDVVFTNPGGEGKSRVGLDAHIMQFRTANPGTYFSTDKIYDQRDKLLALWSMYKPDGVKVANGYNFVTPGADGRFIYMAGFF